MKLIKQKAELLPWEPGVEGVYKAIERAGRTCYKSEDKITEGSAKPFVDRMIASNHLAMLEHGTVYLAIPISEWHSYKDYSYGYLFNPYSKVNDTLIDWVNWEGIVYITTNYRVLVENNWLDDLKYLCDPTEFHEKRYSFRLITSIGVTRELNRHRVHSIAEQSTRYCNYSKDKFGNEVTFCIPSWLDIPEITAAREKCGLKTEFEGLSSIPYCLEFLNNLGKIENLYLELINKGWQPQQAREVLPLCTASEIVHTAFASDWKHFFDLRLFECTGKVHPNMKELTQLMYNEAEKQGILFDIIYDSRTIN